MARESGIERKVVSEDDLSLFKHDCRLEYCRTSTSRRNERMTKLGGLMYIYTSFNSSDQNQAISYRSVIK